MKSLWIALKLSLQLPQKKAAFGLNRIGMDTTVFYLFILIGISTLPALIVQLTADDTSGLYVHFFFILIYFFMFNYLISVIIIFVLLSIIAYIALIISRVLKRKLHYSILWKTAAFSTTIPLILFTIISFFYSELSYLFFSLMVIFTMFIIVRVILIYPKTKVS